MINKKRQQRSSQIDKEPDMDEEIEHPQNKKIKVELPPFTEPFNTQKTR